MAQRANKEVAAEVSVRKNGNLYIGIKARDYLDVGYNDEVSVRLHDAGPRGSDVTVSGHIDAGGHIYIGTGLARSIHEETESRLTETVHTHATIAPGTGVWEDDNDPITSRYEAVPHLKGKPL